MKTVYMYAAVVAPTAVLVVGIMLWSQTPSTASVEKTAQYQRSAINQNPTAKVQNTAAHNSDNNRINVNGFGYLNSE
jgi:hypothetical protein